MTLIEAHEKKLHYQRLALGLHLDTALQGVPILKGSDFRTLTTALVMEDSDSAKTALLQIASIIEQKSRADERKKTIPASSKPKKLDDDEFLQGFRDGLGLRY